MGIKQNPMIRDLVKSSDLLFKDEAMDRDRQITEVVKILGLYGNMSNSEALRLIKQSPIPKSSSGRLILIVELQKSYHKTSHQRTVELLSKFMIDNGYYKGIDLDVDINTKHFKVNEKYPNLKKPRVYWTRIKFDNLQISDNEGLALHSGLLLLMYFKNLAKVCSLKDTSIGLSEYVYSDKKDNKISLYISYDNKSDILKINNTNFKNELIYPSIK